MNKTFKYNFERDSNSLVEFSKIQQSRIEDIYNIITSIIRVGN